MKTQPRALALLLAAAVLLLPPPSAARDEARLSPRHWPREEIETFLPSEAGRRAPPSRFESRAGLIVGTSSPFAVHAGIRALQAGGSAADAALVTSLAQIVHAAGSVNSFAGILYAVCFDAPSGEVHALNAGYSTALAEDDPLSIPANPAPSGRTALVPGFPAGFEELHRRFGRLPFRELFEPALHLAEEGFVVDDALAGRIRGRREALSRREETRAVFNGEKGRWLERGDRLRQPALARTLRSVAEEGAAFMYTGAWAGRFVAAVREEGGKMEAEDLRRYAPAWGRPIEARYRRFVVHTLPPPELGSVQLVEALNILDASRIDGRGHYTRSPEALYWLMQICRFGHVVTYTPDVYQPDPQGPVREGQITPPERLDPEAGPANWRKIQERGWEGRLHEALRARGSHSDANVVVDRAGNVVVLLHSINALNWGTTGLFVDGVSIPDSGAHNQRMMARVGPGARLPNITNPLLVTREGRPFLGAASIGSSLHEQMLLSLVDILGHGMDPAASSRTPKFWGPVWRRSPEGSPAAHPQAVNEGSFPRRLLDAVRARGQEIEELGPSERGLRTSLWIGIQIDPRGGRRRGAGPVGEGD